MISESNPLQQFFHHLVERNYSEVGVRSFEVQSYVANLLTEFCEGETVYKIKDPTGKPLHDVGEMLLADGRDWQQRSLAPGRTWRPRIKIFFVQRNTENEHQSFALCYFVRGSH